MPSSERSPSPRSRNLAKGKAFENKAAAFYRTQGYTVLERNWRAGRREIDLIVQRGDLIVFVEVKYTGSGRFGHPVFRVNHTKRRRLIEAAEQYITAREYRGVDFRFDVVAFPRGKLEHFPDAFSAESDD